ncbi:MAG: DUF2218 domain-containing protein [Actinomycetota bacterium]|nr:DUF2218 domain-containing protein [Actinomycetota bacterium]
MLTAHAVVRIERSSRYLVQLCRHAGAMGDTSGHRLRIHGGGEARHKVRLHAEYSETHRIITVAPWGRCTLQASPEALMLCIEAPDGDSLRRLQGVVTSNLERFGRRDRLTVSWQQPIATAARPGDIDPAQQPRPRQAAQRAARGRCTTVVLASAGVLGMALVVAVHLGLSAAMVAASRWVGWTAVSLVVVPVVAVGGHAVAVTLLGRRALTIRRKINSSSVRDDRQTSQPDQPQRC